MTGVLKVVPLRDLELLTTQGWFLRALVTTTSEVTDQWGNSAVSNGQLVYGPVVFAIVELSNLDRQHTFFREGVTP